MPRPGWKSTCDCPCAPGWECCPNCGASRPFDGHSFGMIETMGRYSRIFGVSPMGPHRRLTDQLLGPLRAACGRCRGEGLLSWDEERWSYCWACEGDGGFWTRSPATIEALRRKIAKRFPSWVSSSPRRGGFGSGDRDQLPPATRAAAEWEEGATVYYAGRQRPSRVLVHAESRWAGGVFFASLDWTWKASRVHEALGSAGNWGEFRGRMDDQTLREFLRSVGAEGVAPPDKAYFDPGELGLAPGEPLPPWLQIRQEEFVPRWFLERFGRLKVSWGDPSYWSFGHVDAKAMLEALRDRGQFVINAQEAGGLTFW